MGEQLSSDLGARLRLSSWPAALVGIVFIKAVLTFALEPGSFLLSYSGISYFLLLLLATGFAVRNAVQNTLGGRPFWVLFAGACGLWSMDQCISLYYELGRHIEVPNSSMADPLLFLHIVPLMAAVATLPRGNVSGQRPHRAILNFIFLLIFWSFFYGYFVFPYQFLYPNPSYASRFDILYLLENLALVLAAGILSFRALTPWRSIYLHLLAASTLYLVSSTIANLAIDSGGYVNGRLYGLGLTSSACWFVWIPLAARQAGEIEVKETPSADWVGIRASWWAMYTAVIILIPIAWELIERNENSGLRTLRLLLAIAALVGLASATYLKEYLARQELLSDLSLADDRMRLAMQAGNWVGWDLDFRTGSDIWFGDLPTIFGIPADRHLATQDEFIHYIHPEDRKRISEALAEARHNRKPYSEEFRILRPDGTVRWLAGRGKVYFSAKGDAERMVGLSLDITERRLVEDKLREYEKALEGSEEMIAVVDRDYRFLIANRKYLRVRNMTKEQVIGHSISEVLNKGVFESGVKQKLDECFLGKVVRFEMKYTYPDLGERDILISYFPIEGPSGIDRVVSIVQDITDRKRLEQTLTGMSRKLIEAQEQERTRIARELHDDINQRLALLTLELEQNSSGLSTAVRSNMHELQKRTEAISTDLHHLACDLHTPNLEHLSIFAVLKNFCREFSVQRGVEIDFTHDDPPQHPVSEDVSLCLFRILQEALHNSLQHSKVRNFSVSLQCAPDHLFLKVADQGIGFDVESAMIKGGLGLISMHERLRLVDGSIAVHSQPMQGTTIEVRVPLVHTHAVDHHHELQGTGD